MRQQCMSSKSSRSMFVFERGPDAGGGVRYSKERRDCSGCAAEHMYALFASAHRQRSYRSRIVSRLFTCSIWPLCPEFGDSSASRAVSRQCVVPTYSEVLISGGSRIFQVFPVVPLSRVDPIQLQSSRRCREIVST